MYSMEKCAVGVGVRLYGTTTRETADVRCNE